MKKIYIFISVLFLSDSVAMFVQETYAVRDRGNNVQVSVEEILAPTKEMSGVYENIAFGKHQNAYKNFKKILKDPFPVGKIFNILTSGFYKAKYLQRMPQMNVYTGLEAYDLTSLKEITLKQFMVISMLIYNFIQEKTCDALISNDIYTYLEQKLN